MCTAIAVRAYSTQWRSRRARSGRVIHTYLFDARPCGAAIGVVWVHCCLACIAIRRELYASGSSAHAMICKDVGRHPGLVADASAGALQVETAGLLTCHCHQAAGPCFLIERKLCCHTDLSLPALRAGDTLTSYPRNFLKADPPGN